MILLVRCVDGDKNEDKKKRAGAFPRQQPTLRDSRVGISNNTEARRIIPLDPTPVSTDPP